MGTGGDPKGKGKKKVDFGTWKLSQRAGVPLLGLKSNSTMRSPKPKAVVQQAIRSH